MKHFIRGSSLFGAVMLVALMLVRPALAESAPAAAPAAQPAPAPVTPAKAPATPAKPMHASAKKMHHAGMSLARRKAIQEALNSHGAKLKVDGMLGRQSREAIKKFQKANGLKATGWANKATLAKLGVK